MIYRRFCVISWESRFLGGAGEKMHLEAESVESLDESREQCTDGSPIRRASHADRDEFP